LELLLLSYNHPQKMITKSIPFNSYYSKTSEWRTSWEIWCT